MTTTTDILRIAAIGAVLLAGSCASPYDDFAKADGAAHYPIAVEPQYTSIKLSFSAPEAGLLPDDAARFEAFIADYLSRGSGSISVSAPQGSDSAAVLSYFGARLFAMGVPRSRILVGTRDGADSRVEIGFIAYMARTAPCGDWSEDAGESFRNRTTKNFGCAVQHNIAAQVADPRDLIEMRPTDPSDAARRSQVIDNYEKGKVTAADKSKEQSGAVSEVNKE
ncbi:CpaD family pilus assembly protein [Rhizomicrobium electricum]|jgi:pilus assembly protein CpaD|uniref:CpaD family pilus assembly protein n=1 Tax=Rhizomicrobium electricum TaxID=480070 RepID=A0ABN1F4T0_9PROT|nr:CpaD family pilus assembly protein [Rhizomicrobium electricum]NIJ49434.1 pilus assembly protein CpaD [Rhizomicrobium electricum]